VRGFSNTGSSAWSAGPNLEDFHHGEEEEEVEDPEVICRYRCPSFKTGADRYGRRRGFGSTFAKIKGAGLAPASFALDAHILL
jgi:hypothetical protein